jgi:hypothetical protein
MPGSSDPDAGIISTAVADGDDDSIDGAGNDGGGADVGGAPAAPPHAATIAVHSASTRVCCVGWRIA